MFSASDLMGFLEQFAYGGLVAVLLAAGLGVPIPEDIPLMLGGILSARGITSAYLIFAFAYFAILAGDYIIFSMGRRLGPAALQKPWAQKLLTHKRQRVLRRHFLKYGPLTIVAARHMAGLRAPCFLMAGVAGMSPLKFLLADGFGACLSVPLFIWLGYKFGENLDAILAYMDEAKAGILIAAAVAVVVFLVVKVVRGRKGAVKQDPVTHERAVSLPPADRDLSAQEIRQVGVALEAEPDAKGSRQ